MLKRKKLLYLTVAAIVLILAATVIALMLRLYKREVTISIAGDILLDRGVAAAIAQHGMDYPYAGVSDIFKHDDITIANLECPLTLAEGGGAMKEKSIVFKADPANAGAMKSAGFDVLALANNHTMDYVSSGLADTMAALTNAGLLYAGAGSSRSKIEPCFIEKNGVRVGILSYSSLPPEGFMDNEHNATISYARDGFLDEMQKSVADTAAQCDFLIVYFHWGIEYRHDVTDAQKEVAHTAVDSGASLVVGAHPHVLQGQEMYRGVPIYYSLGNFVFDRQLPSGTDEALILQFTINKQGLVGIEEIPCIIENCQPRPAEGEQLTKIAADLERYRFPNS